MQLSRATLNLGCIIVIDARIGEILCGIGPFRQATTTEKEPYYSHDYQRPANTPDYTTCYRAFIR